MHSLLRATLATFGVGIVLATVSADDKAKPFSDEAFVKKAASGGMLEVELGKLAQIHATREDVKAFGGRLVTDHSKANQELMNAAKAAGIAVAPKMSEKHQKELEHFAKLQGAQFDQEFTKAMVKDHKHDITLFEKASKEAKSQQIKDFATKTLPVLKEHLKIVEKLAGSEK